MFTTFEKLQSFCQFSSDQLIDYIKIILSDYLIQNLLKLNALIYYSHFTDLSIFKTKTVKILVFLGAFT